MALSLAPSADGNSVDLKLGSTVLATFTNAGVSAGTILANSTDAQGLSNALKLLTPGTLNSAFGGSNQSLSGSGYQKFPGGLIIQWGTFNSADASTAVVPLPITFPTSCRSVMVTDIANSTSTVQTRGAIIDSPSQFTLWNTSVQGISIYWMAVGY